MRWRKLGLVYCPDGSQWWARTHAHLPTADVLDDGRIRVYFAGLDEHQYGRIGWVDVDAANPLRVLEIGQEPVLDLGEPGTFDDSGVVPSCVIDVGPQKYLYYIGFQRAQRVPYMLFSGLAISDDGVTFTRYARTPLLDRTPAEPFSRSAPMVLPEAGAYRMWYWSCLRWTGGPNALHYNNVIRCAVSPDGLTWTVDDHICVQPDFIVEYSIGRPAVVHDGDIYRMWYAIRAYNKPSYRIGYAESVDGVVWTRHDDRAGIAASASGWDSEMICYPNIVTVKNTHIMFYNGNGHGKSGFGCAVLEA